MTTIYRIVVSKKGDPRRLKLYFTSKEVYLEAKEAIREAKYKAKPDESITVTSTAKDAVGTVLLWYELSPT